MIGASKILTVSYGTFSCTLEGFDEPFNTMKAIAEYFRDLAADDRYFGAEPPTPDAAMLHKIAEREIQRRVEAKIGDHGVHLRAQDNAVAELQAPAVAEPSALPTLTAMPDGVAARLARIRASVAKGDADIAPLAAAFVEPVYTEDQHADEFAEELTDLAIFDDAEIAPMDTAPVAADVAPADDLALSDDIDDAETRVELALRDAGVDAVDEPEADAFDMADLDLGADLPEPTPASAEDAPDDDLSARLGALIDPEAAQDAEPAENHTSLDATLETDADAADDMAMTHDISDAQADAPAETLVDPEPAAEVAEKALVAEDIADAAAQPADAGAVADDIAETAPEPIADTPIVSEEPAPAPELSEKLQRARARVIRIRRNAALAPAPVAETAPPADLSPKPAAAADASLTVEAEADLARTLAALEDEPPVVAAQPPADVVAAQPPADDDADLRRQLAMIEDDATATAPDQPVEPAANAAIADAVQDAAVSRLMQQTQSEMAVPENRRRLSAIAHLKAAVAATVAERFGSRAKADTAEATRAEPYRDDLARVVRPRRPEGTATANARPAPLVLVSAQRIDRPAPPATPAPAAPVTVTPVRPRRVSSAALAPQLVEDFDEDEDDDDTNIFTDARGFAEFADRLGAHSLPDMLEAAAAYAATVEGRPSFSRPQLMKQVSVATGESDISREDGLRSFGTLLRDGRIVKVRRGQFALTDQSRFLTEAKRIAD